MRQPPALVRAVSAPAITSVAERAQSMTRAVNRRAGLRICPPGWCRRPRRRLRPAEQTRSPKWLMDLAPGRGASAIAPKLKRLEPVCKRPCWSSHARPTAATAAGAKLRKYNRLDPIISRGKPPVNSLLDVVQDGTKHSLRQAKRREALGKEFSGSKKADRGKQATGERAAAKTPLTRSSADRIRSPVLVEQGDRRRISLHRERWLRSRLPPMTEVLAPGRSVEG